MTLSRLQKAAIIGSGVVGGYAAFRRLAWQRAMTSASGRGGSEASPGFPRVVILGAGFAGTYAARELARQLPEGRHITLVDQRNFFLFTPMLSEVVGGEVDDHDIVCPIRRLAPDVTLVQGRVDGIDLRAKRISLTIGGTADGIPTEQRTLQADQIVIAVGSVTNFHHIPGLAKHALTIKSIADAQAIHDRAAALLERANVESDPDARRGLLTFVVGGGGFSGVETIAALNDLVRGSVRHFPHVRPEDIQMVLVHSEERLLPELSADLAEYALRKLRANGVEVVLNARITAAGAEYVDIQGRPRIPAHTLIWTGGVAPSPLIGVLDAKRGHHGALVVDNCFHVIDHPDIWAIGDCAEIPEPDGRDHATYPPTAQDATREGKHLARNIVATLRGQPPQAFTYRPIGEVALVGRRSAVASLYGRHISGLPAWAMWRVIYLAKQPEMSRRTLIAVHWLVDLAFGREVVAIPARHRPAEAGAEAAHARAG